MTDHPLWTGVSRAAFSMRCPCQKDLQFVKRKFFPELEAEMGRILSDKQNFEKLHVSKDFAAQMFSYNPFKMICWNKFQRRELSFSYHPPNNMQLFWLVFSNMRGFTENPLQFTEMALLSICAVGLIYPLRIRSSKLDC